METKPRKRRKKAKRKSKCENPPTMDEIKEMLGKIK